MSVVVSRRPAAVLALELLAVPGHAGSELLEIGLEGNGTVARTILRSLRAA